MGQGAREHLKVLITVKTYPIPSAKYEELVCTAGVTEEGDFIRLYPINFRELPFGKQYRKYQWLEVDAVRHRDDPRKESYRPDCNTLRFIGEPIPANPGNWAQRAEYVLKKRAGSLEELRQRRKQDNTSIGIFRPKSVDDLIAVEAEREWKRSFRQALQQARLWDDRTVTRQPPRKVPYKFQYIFTCNDTACKGHTIMVEDWEIGRLYWRLIDDGASEQEAVKKIRKRFLDEICGPDKDTHFYVGTIKNRPGTWLIIGLFYPKKKEKTGSLFT